MCMYIYIWMYNYPMFWAKPPGNETSCTHHVHIMYTSCHRLAGEINHPIFIDPMLVFNTGRFPRKLRKARRAHLGKR